MLDRVVALPRAVGPALPGVSGDVRGFVRCDRHGKVAGTSTVWAAGDAIAFPVKQGGLAAQQADAVAEAIAARAGADILPRAVSSRAARRAAHRARQGLDAQRVRRRRRG